LSKFFALTYTATEENYIKAIYHLQHVHEKVSTTLLSDEMNTRPASVTDMLKKLESKKVVHYQKYRGFSLTEQGNKTALNVVRKGHGLSNYSGAVTQPALINEMLYERRYSLYFEGHRWIDMRRYDRLEELPIARTTPGDGDDVWTEFPLPSTE